MKFSVLMSVYRNDDADAFSRSIDSVTIGQTVMPDQFVLVVDGPVPSAINEVIENKRRLVDDFKVIRLETNQGLGIALRRGMEAVSYDLVARMDSDDLANENRFKAQLEYMKSNPETAVVGGQITEFIDAPDNIVGMRYVPETSEEIEHYIKCRCPFNHMTVMMRRQAVMDVGNYCEWHFNEDYFLWVRMAIAGYKFANLPHTLVNVRVGREMYQRRGGWRYFKSEAGLQGYMLEQHVISLPRYIYNVIGRFVVQVAMPNRLRGYIFQELFRK